MINLTEQEFQALQSVLVRCPLTPGEVITIQHIVEKLNPTKATEA
jgi:hypothetical protein